MPLPAIQAQSLPEIRLNEREQVQYLLGNPPSWMMRYGIATMAAFFAVLLSLSYWVRYPDIAEAPVVLVTTNPAIRILAKNSGRISELFVKEQQSVKAGQLLAIFESPVAWRDVNRLEKWLSTAKPDDDLLSSTLQLGSLQEAYSVFSQHWKECQYFTRHNGVSAKISFLKQQIEQLKAINTNLDKQTAILREEYTLAGKEIVRQNQLHHSQLIADDELEKAEVVYLQHKRQLGAPEAAALQNQMQIRQLESQINDLLQAKSDNSVSQKLTLEEDLLRLQSAIEAWKQNYLILAPIDGKISLSKIWSVQQSIGVGEEIMAVVPFSIQGTAPVHGWKYRSGNNRESHPFRLQRRKGSCRHARHHPIGGISTAGIRYTGSDSSANGTFAAKRSVPDRFKLVRFPYHQLRKKTGIPAGNVRASPNYNGRPQGFVANFRAIARLVAK